jgi:hypothetical protein
LDEIEPKISQYFQRMQADFNAWADESERQQTQKFRQMAHVAMQALKKIHESHNRVAAEFKQAMGALAEDQRESATRIHSLVERFRDEYDMQINGGAGSSKKEAEAIKRKGKKILDHVQRLIESIEAVSKYTIQGDQSCDNWILTH